MARAICMVWDIGAAMRASDSEKLSMYNGPTLAEINRVIMLAYSAGMKVVPSCNNHDERGYCKGHDLHGTTEG